MNRAEAASIWRIPGGACVCAVLLFSVLDAKAQEAGKKESKAEPKTIKVSFCYGVDGYDGTVDAEVWALAPTTILANNPQVTSDANNDGGESQVLMRFERIIGDKKSQIPPGATIKSAKLYVSAFDQGDTVHLHRMLTSFGDAPTWSRLVSGISADGMEAARHKDAFTFGKIAASSNEVTFDVTDTMQAWVSGEENYGWVFINTGGNGWDFYSSDFDKTAQRPRLEVEFVPPASSGGKSE